MLKKLLSLLPVSIVRKIGNSSFASLQERGEVKTWIVGYTKGSSFLENRSDTDLIPGNYYYLGLQIKIVRCSRIETGYQYQVERYWNWFVYDGYGSEIIANSESKTEECAIASVQKWIEVFLNDD